MGKKTNGGSASRNARINPEKRVLYTGGRGGGRPRTSRPASGSALFGRLRRLEVLVTTWMDPAKSNSTSDEIAAMIQAIRECHAGKRFVDGEVVDVPGGRQSAKDSGGNRRRWPQNHEKLTATLGEVAETHDIEDEESP